MVRIRRFLEFSQFLLQFRENCGTTYRRERELSNATETAITSEKNYLKASKSTHEP